MVKYNVKISPIDKKAKNVVYDSETDIFTGDNISYVTLQSVRRYIMHMIAARYISTDIQGIIPKKKKE